MISFLMWTMCGENVKRGKLVFSGSAKKELSLKFVEDAPGASFFEITENEFHKNMPLLPTELVHTLMKSS